MDYKAKYEEVKKELDELKGKLTCSICGKTFDLDKMVSRHQKSSKICKIAFKLPQISSNISLEALRATRGKVMILDDVKTTSNVVEDKNSTTEA